MAEDPLEWLARHIDAGIELREQGWGLRSTEEADAWLTRENRWAAEALDGMAAWNLQDFGRVNTLHWIEIYPLPEAHPWRDVRINPFNCHATRITRLQEIEREWQEVPAKVGRTTRMHWPRTGK